MKNLLPIIFLLCAGKLLSQTTSYTIADSLFKAQNWTAAVHVYSQLTQANPNPKIGLTFNRLGISHYHLGNYREAVPAFRRAIQISKNPAVMYSLACVYNLLNQKDSCYRWLDQASADGFSQYKQIETDNDLKDLRGEKRFVDIMYKVKVNAMPCLAKPDYRHLDFWIGDWKVFDSKTGAQAGISKIELVLNECVIMENWQPVAGFPAKSFSMFDIGTKKWKQTYVTGDGQILEFTDGQAKDGEVQFMLKSNDGLRRMTFSKAEDNNVKQLGEFSRDGKSWSVEYDLTYVRVK